MKIIEQTVILDCCHSAGANRVPEFGQMRARTAPNSPLPPNCDIDIYRELTCQKPNSRTPLGIKARNQDSHDLLAACGRKEYAYEGDGLGQRRGFFTTALLQHLRNHASDKLTYVSLIQRIQLPK